MSRAFVKEAETPSPRCPEPPGCGSEGLPVARGTLAARLTADAAARFGDSAWFCPNGACSVAYYDAQRAWAGRDELREPAWPKHGAAPVCACFAVTDRQIESWARAGDKLAMREFLERTTSPEARCAERAASGASCATEARRVFLRALPTPPGA